MTVREHLETGGCVLAATRPRDQAALESQLLLALALGRPRTWLLSHPESGLPTAAALAYALYVQRRNAGEPLEYITGCCEFYGLSLEVTPATLVPRPETEVLVEAALAELAGRASPSAADVGTGPGAIALAIASNHPTVRLLATDVSPAALTVAARNVAALSLTNRVRLLCCHLLTCTNALFDLIAANLPYVASHELLGTAAPVVRFEPRLALDGGPDGLAVIAELLRTARASLAPGGTILAEIGANQGEPALRLARAAYPMAQVSIVADLAGRDRLLRVRDAPGTRREARSSVIVSRAEGGVRLVAQALRQGMLAVIPTDTVYGLAAVPTAAAVAKLFQAKGRPETRPIPLLIADASVLPAIVADWPPTAAALAKAFWPGGLTIVVRARPELPAAITAQTGAVGVRIPASDVAREVIRRSGGYLAVTSANRSDELPALTAQAAAQTLGEYVAYVLDGGPAKGAIPSTVVAVEDDRVIVYRAGAISTGDLRSFLDVEAPGTSLVSCEGV